MSRAVCEARLQQAMQLGSQINLNKSRCPVEASTGPRQKSTKESSWLNHKAKALQFDDAGMSSNDVVARPIVLWLWKIWNARSGAGRQPICWFGLLAPV